MKNLFTKKRILIIALAVVIIALLIVAVATGQVKNSVTCAYCEGAGCEKCGKSGYKGRKGIFEIFKVDDTVQRLIFDHAPAPLLRPRARELGMRTLREDGMLKVASGMTSLAEVLRVTMGDAD